VLDFQIRLKGKYFKVGTSVAHEKDNNRMVNDEEFLELISVINTSNKNCNRLLNMVDPLNNKQITYTECINLFAKEICKTLQPDKTGNKYVKIKVPDKIFMDENCFEPNMN
jgi:hypothetical protein